ncbi:MAG: hypothetical protein PHW13_03805 [Methylococcales bacterium]|nr:hypothetical protein [Methylococcales bacterium]
MIKQILSSCSWFKLTVLALLSLNVLIYAISHNLLNAIDALCWVLLLIMFELEAFSQTAPFSTATRCMMRNALILVVLAVFFIYIGSNEWLDVGNAVLWFMLIALLELEIRYPQTVLNHPQAYWLATLGVFIGLLAMVGIWLSRSAWLDAYDAVLWIVAFAVIDVDIFKFLQLKSH